MLKIYLCHTVSCVRDVLRLVFAAKGASCCAVFYVNDIRHSPDIQIINGGPYANCNLEKP